MFVIYPPSKVDIPTYIRLETSARGIPYRFCCRRLKTCVISNKYEVRLENRSVADTKINSPCVLKCSRSRINFAVIVHTVLLSIALYLKSLKVSGGEFYHFISENSEAFPYGGSGIESGSA